MFLGRCTSFLIAVRYNLIKKKKWGQGQQLSLYCGYPGITVIQFVSNDLFQTTA